jgi:hypothetical protein
MDCVQNPGSDGGSIPSNSPLIGSSGPQGDSRVPLTQGAGGAEKPLQLEDHKCFTFSLSYFYFSPFLTSFSFVWWKELSLRSNSLEFFTF